MDLCAAPAVELARLIRSRELSGDFLDLRPAPLRGLRVAWTFDLGDDGRARARAAWRQDDTGEAAAADGLGCVPGGAGEFPRPALRTFGPFLALSGERP
jgi:hypothetical protein